MLRLNRHPKRKSGFTLLETASAVGLVAGFIAMLIVGGSNLLNQLRTSKDNISAGQAVQQRVEEIRLASWPQVIDAAWVKDNVFGTPCPSTSGLSDTVETIVVSPYPAKTGFTPAKIVRQNGQATVVTQNPALLHEYLVRVDYSVTWKGFPKFRNRMKATSILVAGGSSLE